MDTFGRLNARRVAYLSAEYLPGPHLPNNLLNLGLTEVTRARMEKFSSHRSIRDYCQRVWNIISGSR
jgi:glucan phosphorylase